MSYILIIKLGSLGDIAQIGGVLRDIRETHNNEKIFILTTPLYIDFLSRCPFIDGVLIDKRIPRWNIYYLLKLRKMIHKYNFTHVYDLQNSSRTSFYRNILFPKSNKDILSSTITTLPVDITKEKFDKNSVLNT